MGLPQIPLRKETIVVGDEKIEVHGLSYAVALRLDSMEGTLEDKSAFLLAMGCDVSEEEVRQWMQITPADVIDTVTEKIMELTGISREYNFQDDSKINDQGANRSSGLSDR